MTKLPSAHRQKGVILVVAMVLLLAITMLVTGNLTQSNSNTQAVGNLQFREEAIAAGNSAIEQVLSGPFTDAPAPDNLLVDIDNDGDNDFNVAVATPQCVVAREIATAGLPPSSVTLGSAFAVPGSTDYLTTWDIDATVTDINRSGATVRVRQGVRVLLSEAQFDSVCS